ncbi:DUF3107 domain-containing protein, partial [Streptomyces sp. NPDC006333]|uniref:DUF3107 domain-containing protein n=1 Tax=Streptomyces sp. NPDC006333 TaxID=3156753 RepID=UPI0033BA0286
MEVKIGVQHAPREIVLESGQTPEEVERAVSEALAGNMESQERPAKAWYEIRTDLPDDVVVLPVETSA